MRTIVFVFTQSDQTSFVIHPLTSDYSIANNL